MSRPSLALLLAASTLAGALPTPTALLAHVQAACTASGPPVCIIDGNNLRGAEFFGSSQGSLRALVEGWADEAQLPALLILDHGPEERAWHVSSHAVLTLSGEGRTADDVIVRDAWYLRHELGRNVFVVTNDQGLIGRVKRYRSPAGSVQVLHTRAFARLLGIEESTATDVRAAWSTLSSWPNGRAGDLRLEALACLRSAAPWGVGRLGPRSAALEPLRRASESSRRRHALRSEDSIPPRLAIQANSRPRETTADRSAAALELAAQLEAGAGGPTENGPSGADALLAQYVTWVMPRAVKCRLGGATAQRLGLRYADSPCSWLRHPLGTSR